MAHFAELDGKGYVARVVVIANDDILDENGEESEAVGISRCAHLFGTDSTWVQTSYNGNFRGKFAGIGDYYDDRLDEFV